MHLSLLDFRREPATHIVGLGMRCEVAYNLRRAFDFSTAYPFDWWITPTKALLIFLANPDAADLYEPAKLELSARANSVRHTSGILLYHEFQRDNDAPKKPVRPEWRDGLDKPRQRTAVLTKRLLGLNAPDNRIAFVRQPRQATRRVAVRLENLFPLAEWTLIDLAAIPRGTNDWRGDAKGWDRALAELELPFDRSRHRPFAAAMSPREDARADRIAPV